MSKKTRRAPTKTRIQDAALELFNRRGATEVTTHDIAAGCGISPGNLYYHYAIVHVSLAS